MTISIIRKEVKKRQGEVKWSKSLKEKEILIWALVNGHLMM
jgi:hypothetical protein